MHFLEKDLEDIIYNVSNDKLLERGLGIRGNKLRQTRIGGYGISDVITYERVNGCLHIDVIELKLKEINIDTFNQALGYAKGIQHYLEHRGFSQKYKIFITLIGHKLSTKSNFCFIGSVIDNVNIYTYKMDFNGVYFELCNDLELTKQDFTPSKNTVTNNDEPHWNRDYKNQNF